ncbi:BTAD domain-containing putative transcriptional regulator [Nakamurella sp.]|uniref:BTAD domain-containing putative transcriptional regulator n=1 Tax=Nakamurella sp. TaxID=1869182 RepID=UPI0037847D30
MNEAGGLTPPELELRVLGELDGVRDGTVIDLGGRRQRAVLAALVIARGDVVSAERLAECVWGDGAAARSGGPLHSYVSHLRRRMQPEAGARVRTDVIVRVGAGYQLSVGRRSVDAWRFEDELEAATDLPPTERARRLRAALNLWRGPAYTEYADEPWAGPEVARLTELRAVARDRLMDARLALGESALVVPELEALAGDDPLREERWRLLVLALYRAGRQGDALAALRRARQTLADELGVEPGPALRTLERDVLAQSPALDGPARMLPAATPAATAAAGGPSAGPGGGSRATAPASGGAHPDLVDRERELGCLARAVDDLCAGVGGLLLIEGSAGIGKTSLLVEAGRLAGAAGVGVLSARASEMERAFGFGTVRQLFEPQLQDPSRVGSLLAGAGQGARPVFETVGDELVENSFAVLHGLYWLTVNLTADGPVLLSVDDVQWCDGASLRFLAYLVKRLESLPVLMVMTVRSGEPQPADGLLADLLLEPTATVLRPQALSVEATGAVVRTRLAAADQGFVATCHRTTSGNPLLLRQLVRALESEGVPPDVVHADTVRAVGSRAVASLVMLRLRRMPPASVEAARAVAFIGADVDLPSIATLAHLPEEQAAEALDLLSRSEILADDRPLRFVHPLVRDAVYQDVSPGERALRHERAARILHERGAPAERIAAHLLLSPARGDAATVAVLRTAALLAAGRGASDSAVGFLRRALDEPPPPRDRVDVLVELGRLESMVDGVAAVEHLTEAYTNLTDPAARAELAMVIARTQAFVGRRGAATGFAAAATEAVPAGYDDERQGLQSLVRITGYMHALPPESYRTPADPPISGTGNGARMLAAARAMELMIAGEDRARAVDLAHFAVADDRLLDDDHMLLWIPAVHVLLMGDSPVDELWRHARSHARVAGSLFAMLAVNTWQGYEQWRRGRLDDAQQFLGDALQQMPVWGRLAIGGSYVAAFMAGVHLGRGDIEAADRVIRDARTLVAVGDGARVIRLVTAQLRLAQGRPEAALTTLADDVGHFDIVNPAWDNWREPAARAYAALGRLDRALEVADGHVALLRRWGAPSWLGDGLVLAGELRGPDGLPQLREALEILETTESVLTLARARLALGRRPEVSDAEAVPMLRQAADTARDCGAQPVYERAVAALADRGESIVNGERAHRMTSRERQVLDLTAGGLDVHQVAQRLFLTPGTVHEALISAAGKTREPS